MNPNVHGSQGSHPHADQPNWRPATDIAGYLQNCTEGLEVYSGRKAAKLLGWSRIMHYRVMQAQLIPDDLFELLVTMRPRIPSWKEMAAIGGLFEGKTAPHEKVCCPHCGGLLRLRPGISAPVLKVVEGWFEEASR